MKKCILIVLDGFGEGVKDPSVNAIEKANIPYIRKLRKENPPTFLRADGNFVGVPEGSMGGSEVGHLTIGAGRIVWQSLEEISRSFTENEFQKNPDFREWIQRAKTGKVIHLLGMISDAGVHSHLSHLYSLLEILKSEGIEKNVYIHAISDGRDVAPESVKHYLSEIMEKCGEIGVGKLVTLCGRYFTMDRDKNWDRTKVAYELLVNGRGRDLSLNGDFEKTLYEDADNDYYLPAYVLDSFPAVQKDSLFLFWNFRTDRAEQITRIFTDPECKELPQDFIFEKGDFLTFGDYALGRAPNLFPVQPVQNSVGEWISSHGLKQLRLAETEKYAHVTFFFNGQEKKAWKDEERILVPSPKCASYAEEPLMSAGQVTDILLRYVERRNFDFILCNFANPDLVGHSGDFDAVVTAVEYLDTCLEKIVPLAREKGYEVIITADHGNADDMKYPDGTPKPSHSMNKVPFLVISSREGVTLRQGEGLGLRDIAPTVFELMELPIPKEMTGVSLIGSEPSPR